MVIISGPLMLRPKLPLVTGIANKIYAFPKDFAVVLGATFVQSVADMNDTVLEGLVYTTARN
jgi:hypothetical protein